MEFCGKRLRNARIYRNMTISELAEKISVTKQAISQYEKNIITPKPDVLFQIVTVLRFPMAFFTENDNFDTNIENTFFRALNSARVLDLDTQETKTKFIVQIYNFLKEYLNFPELDLPPETQLDISNPDEAANILKSLGTWKRPYPQHGYLLERKGIIVSSLPTESQKIDAFTQIHITNGKKLFVVLGMINNLWLEELLMLHMN